MKNPTAFTPGTRVRTFPTGETGTVAESAPRYASLPGFVPVIFDGHTLARPCAADNLVVIDAPTVLTPGDRVSDRGNGRLGIVADDPAMLEEYPGMIPVHWDNGYRTVAAAAILEPAINAGGAPQEPAWDSLQAMELHVIHEIAAAGATPRRFDIGFIVEAAFMWDDANAAFVQKPGKTIAWASNWARLY